MSLPTEAVARLDAWDTSNFDQLSPGAVIEQFQILASDYSEIITFTLSRAQDAVEIATLRGQAEGDAGAIQASRVSAEASELSASQSAAMAAARAAALKPAARAYLFANGDHPWPAL